MADNDGATKAPEIEQREEDKCRVEGVARTFPHYFKWVWQDGHPTDMVRCSTCNQTRIRRHGENDVILDPANVRL